MKLIIISGRSGSGKTIALHVLEDLGYNCIDGVPFQLLEQLIDTVENHCPVLDILCRAQEISGTATVNGTQLATLSKKAA